MDNHLQCNHCDPASGWEDESEDAHEDIQCKRKVAQIHEEGIKQVHQDTIVATTGWDGWLAGSQTHNRLQGGADPAPLLSLYMLCVLYKNLSTIAIGHTRLLLQLPSRHGPLIGQILYHAFKKTLITIWWIRGLRMFGGLTWQWSFYLQSMAPV